MCFREWWISLCEMPAEYGLVHNSHEHVPQRLIAYLSMYGDLSKIASFGSMLHSRYWIARRFFNLIE